MEGPRSLTPADLPSLANLVDAVFMPGEAGKMARCFPALFDESNCENLLAYVDDDRVVSHFGMTQRSASLGGALVRVACVGAVATYPEYRGRGFASTLLKTACDRAFQAGVDFMMISGGLDLYRRAGATEVACDWRVSASRAVAAQLSNESIAIRQMLSEDISFCAAAYATKRAHFIRPRHDWDWFLESQTCMGKPVETLVIERACVPAAYVICHKVEDESRIIVIEHAGDNSCIAAALKLLMERYGVTTADIYVQGMEPELKNVFANAGASLERESTHGTLLLINPIQLIDRARPYLETVLGIAAAKEFTIEESDGAFTFRLRDESIAAENKVASAKRLFGSWDHSPLPGLLGKALPIPSLWYGINYV